MRVRRALVLCTVHKQLARHRTIQSSQPEPLIDSIAAIGIATATGTGRLIVSGRGMHTAILEHEQKGPGPRVHRIRVFKPTRGRTQRPPSGVADVTGA